MPSKQAAQMLKPRWLHRKSACSLMPPFWLSLLIACGTEDTVQEIAISVVF